MNREAVERTFPELATIDDDGLRGGVVGAWVAACVDAGIGDAGELAAVPWFPPIQRELGIPSEAETLVDHSRDVAAGAVALADVVDASGDLDRDLLAAGALIHDVSKLVEYEGLGETAVSSLLGHPYHGVHLIERASLPVECAHIVLSHSDRTSVEPAFLEARLVQRADQVTTAAVRERWAE